MIISNEQRVKRIFLVFFIILVAVLFPCHAFGEDDMLSEKDKDDLTLDINKMNELRRTYNNDIHGYSLTLPLAMEINQDYSEIATIFKDDKRQIEIYKQSLIGITPAGYINYSNTFKKDDVHKVTMDEYIVIDGMKIHVIMWSRPKLSRGDFDLNNYICFDIIREGYIYSIFVKSIDPIISAEEYMYLVRDFTVFEPTKQGNIRSTMPVDVEKRNWNDETSAFYEKYFLDSEELVWGIFEPQTATFSYNKLLDYEKYFRYNFPVILNYSEFSKEPHKNLDKRLDLAWAHGKVLELTLQTTAIDNGNMMYDILAGEYDVFLNDYAKIIADFKHPVLFRLLNEMNGDWCVYSAFHTGKDTLIYKNVYKYIYSIFEKQGANENTIWIWNPNEGSFPNFQWNHALMYYPGDEYADLIGMTAYNTGNYYYEVGERWKEFDELYDPLYEDYCRWFAQPLIITEFACANKGGDKARWIDDMFNKIKEYDRIKMAIWWDGCDWDSQGNIARSYFLDETLEIKRAFKNGLLGPWWLGLYA